MFSPCFPRFCLLTLCLPVTHGHFWQKASDDPVGYSCHPPGPVSGKEGSRHVSPGLNPSLRYQLSDGFKLKFMDLSGCLG